MKFLLHALSTLLVLVLKKDVIFQTRFRVTGSLFLANTTVYFPNETWTLPFACSSSVILYTVSKQIPVIFLGKG